MKKTLLLIMFLFSTISTNFGQTKNELLIKNVETRRFKALVDKNFDFLRNVFSDKLIYVHSSGTIDDKETYIGNLVSGKSIYNEINILELDTHEYAKNLIVNRGKLKMKVNSGTPYFIYFTSIYEKMKSDWKMVSWEATRYTN